MAPVQQAAPVRVQPVDTSSTKSVGIQTTYRDSEAQTAPYTPDYTIRDGEKDPEILSLMSLNQERGLPVGLAEIEKIERARQKKAFQASLPPMTDEASFELRKRMMEEQEMKDWTYREREIDQLQEHRLNLLQQALVERDQENEFVSEQRVEALRQRRTQELDTSISNIQQQRIKNLRKLSKKKATDTFVHDTKRDIIDEYANFASKVYAPSVREGRAATTEVAEVATTMPDAFSMSTLNDLESSLPDSMTSVRIRKPKKRGSVNRSQERKDVIAKDHLETMADLIKKQKSHGSTKGPEQKTIPSWKKNQHDQIVRPSTPVLPDVTPEDPELENAVILLQRLLRGRAVQNIMYEGKDRRLELIQELRKCNHDAPVVVEEDENKKREIEQAARDTVQGEVVSEMLDFMYKQLIHTQQFERVKKYVEKAQEERRRREVEEAGRRQAEEIIRARQDAVYQQIQRVHEETCDDFIDELIELSIEANAQEVAVDESRKEKQFMEDADTPNEMVIEDLVSSFLFPEVQRQSNQRQQALDDRRFVHATHLAIQEALGRINKTE